MRAIAMTDYDSGVALQELPTPRPAPNELLIRVHTSSVNRIDVLVAGGLLKGMHLARRRALTRRVPRLDVSRTRKRPGFS